MTYGELRLQLTKLAPGVDFDLLDGWCQDRYTEILDRLAWQRLEKSAVIETVAPYSTGTVEVAQGSDAVALTGGVFSAPMSGREFRVDGTEAIYTATRVNNTNFTLDRPYEDETAPAATFSVFQRLYTMPADCRLVRQILNYGVGPLARMSRADLAASAPDRRAAGAPRIFAPTFDDSSDPPLIQVELYPIPDQAIGLPSAYTAEAPNLSGTDVTLLPWTRPAALKEGVMANIRRHQEKLVAAADHERQFEKYVIQMAINDGRERGPQRIRMAARHTRYRLERSTNSYPNRLGLLP